MISAQWFAFVCPRVTHCLFRSSPPRNANLESEREFPPYFKRSAEMGGRKRAVIPVLKHGGPEKTHCFKNAGAFWGGMFHVLLDLQRSSPHAHLTAKSESFPTQNANLASRRE